MEKEVAGKEFTGIMPSRSTGAHIIFSHRQEQMVALNTLHMTQSLHYPIMGTVLTTQLIVME
jgi:hypothetical protein